MRTNDGLKIKDGMSFVWFNPQLIFSSLVRVNCWTAFKDSQDFKHMLLHVEAS